MSELTDKQQAFVTHYVACLNGAEAARRAGYADSGARQEAHRLLTNADIRAAIDEQLAAAAMPSNEVLTRLSEMARGSFADFFTVKGRGLTLDLRRAERLGVLHLVKKYSKTKQGTTVELYSSYDALVKLGEHYRLWVQRQELSGADGAPIEVSDARSRLLDRLARHTADADEGGSSGTASGDPERGS